MSLAKQFASASLLETIEDVIKTYQLDPSLFNTGVNRKRINADQKSIAGC